ncbi:MAG: phosphopentomutase, partial [Lachnospiraceae bacterium]|nr:phosphopentomutase [Lachnospiraceae bacterium]
MKRVFFVVLDSFGIGDAPDAAQFGDEGTNTLRSITGSREFTCPNLRKLGLFNIDGVDCGTPHEAPIGRYGRLRERSMGKDTILGHCELAGLVSSKTMP